MIYVPALPEGGELGGTSWELALLDRAALIDGTTITIEFGPDYLSGNSGCNSYDVRYILPESGLLPVPEVESDAQGCSDPASIIDQEIAFQTALPLWATFEIAGDELTLFDASSDATLLFECAGNERSADTPDGDVGITLQIP